jgi:hypothetical protein
MKSLVVLAILISGSSFAQDISGLLNATAKVIVVPNGQNYGKGITGLDILQNEYYSPNSRGGSIHCGSSEGSYILIVKSPRGERYAFESSEKCEAVQKAINEGQNLETTLILDKSLGKILKVSQRVQ